MTITKKDVEECIIYLKVQEEISKRFINDVGKDTKSGEILAAVARAYKKSAEYLEANLLPKAENRKRMRDRA